MTTSRERVLGPVTRPTPSCASAILAGLLATALAPCTADELSRLRDLEASASRVIAASRAAFVFLEGGSGFVVDEEGHLLTNAHVVAEAVAAKRTRIPVHLAGGLPLRADLLGVDPEGDVALLRLVEKGPFPHLELGSSEAVQVGESVVALGDPFLIASANIFLDRAPPDYEPSASLGVVSAVHRNSDTYTAAIQVDVAVNRGNSGGPLLTLDGKVVGINGKIETRFDTGVNTGVGYAIPTLQIKRFLEPLRKAGGGNVRHGIILGLETEERSNGKAGLLVTKVKPGSHAALAGFQEQDRVRAVDGQAVASRSRFAGILGTYPAGYEVLVEVERGSSLLTLRLALVEPGPLPYLGLSAKTDESPDGGARVVSIQPGSPAERAGVKVDDVIVAFGGKRISSHTELELYLQGRMAGEEVDVSVLRGAGSVELKLQVGGKGKS